jgi:UDPglucose 6-dehydrogenase
LRGKRVAFWGLAFKPETDDVREAPSLKLAAALLDAGAEVVGHDPEGAQNFVKLLGRDGARIVDSEYAALEGAHAVVVLTEWRCYRAPDFAQIRTLLAGERPVALDARNIWSPAEVEAAGLHYVGIGVPSTARARS